MPEPSLEQGMKLIREAARQGADYVQTPEVSNMMQLNRKALFEHLASEEDDLSLRAYRALAEELKDAPRLDRGAGRVAGRRQKNVRYPAPHPTRGIGGVGLRCRRSLSPPRRRLDLLHRPADLAVDDPDDPPPVRDQHPAAVRRRGDRRAVDRRFPARARPRP